MIQRSILPLDQIDLSDTPVIGTKAATLGELHRAGIPIPNGFVVPTSAYQDFVEQNGLVETIAEVEALARRSLYTSDLATRLDRISTAFERGDIAAPTIDALRDAFAEIVEETGVVVVRSSAIGEDGPDASFAGQQLSILSVRRFDDLVRALRRCWASLFGLSALRYRARFTKPGQPPAIAVIVQAQIACEAAGTLFTIDPVSGDDQVVVEAVWGLGEALAQGEVSPDRYLVDRETLGEAARPRIGDKRCRRVPDLKDGTRIAPVPLWRRRRPVLDPVQLSGLVLLGLQIERLLGTPQDVEWGMAGGRWYVFQSRAITAVDTAAEDGASAIHERKEWTSGFLDERLSEPVSPLGWSILRSGLENVAFREPLRMLGVDPADLEPITRLWNGRPYVNVAVFEALYKLFPDFLLPEDARRFFPGGNVERRKRARRPRSLLAPEVWIGLIRAVARDPAVISPFSNDRAWEAFEREYVQAMREISFSVDVLERQSPPSLARVLGVIDEVERYNRRLLEIHRWSLTDAEVWYSLLRRVARLLLGDERAAAYCSAVVADLDDYSMDLNRALGTLVDLARNPRSESFQKALREFLIEHGHRSFSLDLIRPSFAADPSQVLALVCRDRESEPGEGHGATNGRNANGLAAPSFPDSTSTDAGNATTRPEKPEPSPSALRAPVRWVLAPLAELTRRYVRLRENQRLTWQRGLALLRRLYLLAGRALVREGVLAQPDDVFFLAADEVRQAAAVPARGLQARAAERARRYVENCESTSYPRFLRGNRPLDEDDVALAARTEPGVELRGEPVSPGIGRGKARIILHPDDLDRIEPGDVLVTRGADPGWTPVFDRLAALVMETGGQLSHASVVAREYRLPAVVGIASATNLIQSGEDLIVDGSTGVVRRVRPANPAPRPTADSVRPDRGHGERA